MQQIIQYIIEHSVYAPWISFAAILLAGFNLPVSIDLILVLNAFLAAQVIPEYKIQLYLSVLFGSYFSAWIAYWIGRLVGSKLLQIRWFSKVLNQERLDKVRRFYEKYALLTLIVGRFIPFGFRNCLFITTGMSKIPFRRFMLQDGIACFIWSSLAFLLFYNLGRSYETLVQHLKLFNLVIISALGVTLIGVIWYKRKKRNQPESPT
ncbi:MAG: DedA family protein [Candidatus Doudnabacteria bacterium]|nr:DedA family protein [Candidatus Doudnabacteria bacterium]